MENSELLSGTEKILLVEDEEEIRILICETLELCGYQVIEAKNGFEAISIYEREGDTIDLVITDLVMPRMGGQALADYLSIDFSKKRILYMSGYTDAAPGEKTVRLNFIEKPFTPQALARRVREILDSPEETNPKPKFGF